MTSFDDAIRAYFDAPLNAIAIHETSSCVMSSGCDTCGHGQEVDTSIIITAFTPAGSRPMFYESQIFNSLPALWQALDPDNTKDA